MRVRNTGCWGITILLIPQRICHCKISVRVLQGLVQGTMRPSALKSSIMGFILWRAPLLVGYWLILGRGFEGSIWISMESFQCQFEMWPIQRMVVDSIRTNDQCLWNQLWCHQKQDKLKIRASQVVLVVKNYLQMQEMQEMLVKSLGQEDPPQQEMATHSSMLAWRIPWTEKPGGLQSIGLQRVRHDWSDLASTQNKSVKVSFNSPGWLLW